MFGLGRKGRPIYSPDLGHTIRELPPLYGPASGTHFISIPAKDIPALATQYFAAMATEESEKWCRCEWIIHPDDGLVHPGACRECTMPKGAFIHVSNINASNIPEGAHTFKGKRMRRGEEANDCPVHTKEGMLIYFFEWIFSNGE